MIYGIGVFARSVGRHVMPLAGFADIAVCDRFAVDNHGNTIADGTDFFRMPGVQRSEVHVFRDDNAVYCAMLLIIVQPFVNGRIVIKKLRDRKSVV